MALFLAALQCSLRETVSVRQTLLAIPFIFLSWFILKVKSHLYLKVYNGTMIELLELLSILVLLPGYWLLLRVLLLPISADGKTGVAASSGGDTVSNLLVRNRGGAPMWWISLTSFCSGCRLRSSGPQGVSKALVLLSVVLVGIHYTIHRFIPKEHRQSQEIVLLLSRVGLDTALLVAAATMTVRDIWTRLIREVSLIEAVQRRQLLLWLNLFKNFCFGVGLLLVVWMFGVVEGTATLPHLRRSVLGPQMDACSGEGMELNPTLSTSWVLPAILPRRFFNFYTGSEECHSSSWHSSGFVVLEEELLLIRPTCPNDGQKPRVYLERPENSEFNGEADAIFVETLHGNEEYHQRLKELYADEKSQGVIVRRNINGVIQSVEWDPSLLKVVDRSPASPAEKEARVWWNSDEVIALPMGRSAAYSVQCGTDEEYFVQPLKKPEPWARGTRKECPPDHKPSSSILLLMFDAVSRQGVARRLPTFVEWARQFEKRESKKLSSGEEGYIVRELHHTTLGMSTAGNVGPYFAGTSVDAEERIGRTRDTLNFMNRSVFNIAKEKLGETVSTSFTTGYCSDISQYLLFGGERTSGRGERFQGIDYYTFQPFCHAEYGGRFGNFMGPYSILRRCIDHRFVHEHIFDFQTTLLARQLREESQYAKAHGCEKVFLDVVHFVEGHEGTHAAIHSVDKDLTKFMERLDGDLKFFENPRNTLLVIGDHGNHMGPYFELFEAGQMERTSPLMLYFLHSQILKNIDKRKKLKEGTTQGHFMERSRRLSTPLDLYLTLGDILDIPLSVGDPYTTTEVPAASLLVERTNSTHWKAGDPITTCRMLFNGREGYKCLLDYCVPS